MGRRNKDWKSLLEPVPGIDWTRVIVHGIFGVVVGAFVGFLYGMEYGSFPYGCFAGAVVGAILGGIAAAVVGDPFWDWLTGRWS